MGIEQVAFEIPKYITKGIEDGKYVRIGGVVRDVATGAVVKMLKEAPKYAQKSSEIVKAIVLPIAGAIGVAAAKWIQQDGVDFIKEKIESRKTAHETKETENIIQFKKAI